MSERQDAHEQHEAEQILRDNAYQTLLAIKELQLEELISLQGQPEAFELYLADRQTIYENLIKKEAETNPLIWEIYQKEKQNNPSKLEEAQTNAKQETSPEQRIKLSAQAYQRKTYQKIWKTISPELTKEEQEKLKKAINKNLDSPL